MSQTSSESQSPISFELPPDLSFLATGKKRERRTSFGYSGSRNTTPMTTTPLMPKPAESAVDRLIALAVDEKPSARQPNSVSNGSTGLEHVSMVPGVGAEQAQILNSLMQFRHMLPFFSRLMDASQAAAAPVATAELTRNVGEIALSQRDLRTVVQEQTVQIKRLEDEVNRAREAAERNNSDATEIIDDVRSVQSTVRKASIALGVLLTALICLVIWTLVQGHTH